MFWGLIMEPQKRYSQSVKKSFHISHAAMDTATGDNEKCQVMVVVDGQNFLVCTLQKGKTIQTPLDLFFREGEVISFITNGKCHIHLTGYLDLDYDDMDGEEEEDEEGESSDEEVPELVEEVTSKKNKRKSEEVSPEVGHLSKKQKKELKKKEQEAKKAQEENSDDSSSDDSVDIQKLLEEDETDEADDSYMPNDISMEKLAEDDDDDEDDSDDEEDEEDDDDESEEEKSKPEPASLKKEKKEKNKQQQPTTPQINGHAEKKNKNKENEQKHEAKSPVTPQKEKKVLTGNVAIEDLRVGTGATAKPGKMVQVLYEGRLKSNNKMFDSCQKTPGFKFRLGKNEVIKAWDVGVVGMKIGGKRRIVCPPGMAYGNKGSPPLIPANSTLVFDVELKGVN